MIISKDIMEQLVTADLQTLWEHFLLLEGEYENYEKTYQKARHGIKIPFDIYSLWNPETLQVREEKGRNTATIRPGNGTESTYKINDYWTETELRKTLLRKAIYEHMSTGTEGPRIEE